MKFRITHALLLTAVVAIFAYGLSSPDYVVVRWFRFGGWAAAALLVVRAVSRPAERRAIACGLLVAGSYLAVVKFDDQSTSLPTTAALRMIYPRKVEAGGAISFGGGPAMPIRKENPNADEFRTIGEYGFATLFGLMAAGLAVYWTEETTNLKEPAK